MYKLTVKGNMNVSFDQARRKLTRNILLAAERKSLKNTLKRRREFIYGNMRIIVKSGTIIEIENYIIDVVPNWTKDEEKYERITKELGIHEDKNKKRKYIY
jgi:hypothetical protein